MVGPEALVEAARRRRPAVPYFEEQVVEASHQVGIAVVFADHAFRPRAGETIRRFASTGSDGVEIAAEHDSSD